MYTIWKTTFSCRPGSMATAADTSTWTARTVRRAVAIIKPWTDGTDGPYKIKNLRISQMKPKNNGNTWQKLSEQHEAMTRAELFRCIILNKI